MQLRSSSREYPRELCPELVLAVGADSPIPGYIFPRKLCFAAENLRRLQTQRQPLLERRCFLHLAMLFGDLVYQKRSHNLSTGLNHLDALQNLAQGLRCDTK